MTNTTCFNDHRLFTFWMVFVVLLDTFVFVDAARMAVSRMSKGDKFTNPYSAGKRCAVFQARCSELDLLQKCDECICNFGNETYRSDVKRCVSSKSLYNYTGCSYKGIMDAKLITLDLTKKGTKNINGPLNVNPALNIECDIGNKSRYLNQNKWMILQNISQVLRVDVSEDQTINRNRYLILNWEGVDKDYRGLLVKLHIECKSVIDGVVDSNCFLFKTKGSHIVSSNSETSTSTTAELSTQNSHQTHSTSNEYTTSSSLVTRRIIPTRKNMVYSGLRNIIIGVSAGVGFVVLTIVILAICCVRYRTRKAQETKQVPSDRNEVPKVHFTAQTRFSLIRETAEQTEPAAEPNPDDYTCLQDKRESYDPYFSLRKDDVDLDVIDQILKEAVSMESMEPSSEPRYSCRLSGDETVIITAEPARPRSPEISHEYNVLEEPDYEEVDSSSDDDDGVSVATKLLESKPPLPERQYHTLEPPKTTTMYSEC